MASYKVQRIQGKGYGVIATEKITRGSLIFADKPTLTVPTGAENHVIEAAFERLSPQDKQTFLSLHEGRAHYTNETKLARIFKSNSFADEHNAYILPLTSRINHSCVPNAGVLNTTVRAERDIDIGEEISICYKQEWDEVLTASQRNFLFKNNYGFQCSCKACLPSKQRWISDRRRQLIGAIRFALEGKRPTDFGNLVKSNAINDDPIFRKAHWPPKVPTIKPIHDAIQRIEYTFLLARLREAEGLGSMSIADAYLEAAGQLFDLQQKYEKRALVPGCQLLFVEAAHCCVAWMEKAIAHRSNAEGPNGESVRAHKQGLETLRTGSILWITFMTAGEKKLGVAQNKMLYAICLAAFGREPPRLLTLQESEKLLKRLR